MTPLLITGELSRNFGALAAVSEVSLAVQPGEFRAIIGPNGAGKTTFFNLLAGRLPPSKGRIEFEGKDVTGMDDAVRCRHGISRTFQITNIFPELTVNENVRLAIQLKGGGNFRLAGGKHFLRKTAEEADESLALLGLQDRADLTASTLPHGDQKLLEMAMAVAQRPKLLLLDEPTQGLSANDTSAAVEVIQHVARERQLTVILIEHDMDVVFKLADRVAVLNFGRVIADGTPEDVRANPLVQQAYLGADP
jgi:branched-chain amino acid transport system ATP-binding protein